MSRTSAKRLHPGCLGHGRPRIHGRFFCYLPKRLPYTGAGGEAIAEVAVPILAGFAK